MQAVHINGKQLCGPLRSIVADISLVFFNSLINSFIQIIDMFLQGLFMFF